MIGSKTVWGHQLRWDPAGNITVNPNNPRDVTVVWSDRRHAESERDPGCFDTAPGNPPNYDPCNAGPSSNTNVYISVRPTAAHVVGPAALRRAPRPPVVPVGRPQVDGTLAVAWDEDVQPAGGTHPVNDQFCTCYGQRAASRRWAREEQLDVSVTHWAGQYVPQRAWPTVCGPDGTGDPAFDAPGKDCNEFHGDYTGLAVDSLDRVHVTWTGLNRHGDVDPTRSVHGWMHDGYAQDAMYARR